MQLCGGDGRDAPGSGGVEAGDLFWRRHGADLGEGGGVASPAAEAVGSSNSMLRSSSVNLVATMKKITSKNTTSIIGVRFTLSVSSLVTLRGMVRCAPGAGILGLGTAG